jgi:hypothetical protein
MFTQRGLLLQFILFQVANSQAVDLDNALANLNSDGSILVLKSTSSMLIPIRNTAPDTDLGPWCKNFTLIDKKFHTSNETARPIYNYPINNVTCGTNPGCLMPGCVMYRETVYKSGIQQWLGCSVVFPWWYGAGPAGNRTSLPCPLFDNLTSTFTFRGVEYYNFMRDYGHPYGATDCHKNIMCSPSTHYFDDTQYATLKWCQETPIGFYSPQCNNSLIACTVPTGVNMAVSYFSSHGRGVADGCGVRRTTPATIPNPAISPNSTTPIFSYLVNVVVSSLQWAISTTSTTSIIFGLFPRFYIGLLPTGFGQVSIVFYHANWTVNSTASTVASAPVMISTDTVQGIAVQGDGKAISFWLNGQLVGSTYPQTVSTATVGSLNMTGLPTKYTDGSLVHVGFFSAGIIGDFVSATTSRNPYGTTDTFSDITVSDIRIVDNVVFTSTTTTTTTTVTITASTTTTNTPPTTITTSASPTTTTTSTTTMTTTTTASGTTNITTSTTLATIAATVPPTTPTTSTTGTTIPTTTTSASNSVPPTTSTTMTSTAATVGPTESSTTYAYK